MLGHRNLPKRRTNHAEQLNTQLYSTTTFIMFSAAVRASVGLVYSSSWSFADDCSAPHSLVSLEAPLPREPSSPQLLFDKVRLHHPHITAQTLSPSARISLRRYTLRRRTTIGLMHEQPISSKISISANSKPTKRQPSRPTTPKAMSKSSILHRHQSLLKRLISRVS